MEKYEEICYCIVFITFLLSSQSAGTSQNLVSSLFPMLSLAVEADEPVLAVKTLEAAKTWITENVKDVDKMMER